MTANQALFECIRSYKRSRVLTLALNAGVLSAVQSGDGSLENIAQRLFVDIEWLKQIINVLLDLDLVEEYDGRYSLSVHGQNAQEDPALMAFAGYHYHCYEAWLSLPQAFSSGEPQGFHVSRMSDPSFARAYLQSMDAMSLERLAFLEEKCASLLTGKVLDVGAGPATLTRRLAGNDGSRVTAVDLPDIVVAARDMFGQPENFNWVACDFFSYRPRVLFDAAFCSHFLEYCPTGHLGEWLRVIGTCLRPLASLVVVVFLRAKEDDADLDLDLFELSTGLNGSHLGHLCTAREFRHGLISSGFTDVTIDRAPRGASYSEYLITCKKATASKADEGVEQDEP